MDNRNVERETHNWTVSPTCRAATTVTPLNLQVGFDPEGRICDCYSDSLVQGDWPLFIESNLIWPSTAVECVDHGCSSASSPNSCWLEVIWLPLWSSFFRDGSSQPQGWLTRRAELKTAGALWEQTVCCGTGFEHPPRTTETLNMDYTWMLLLSLLNLRGAVCEVAQWTEFDEAKVKVFCNFLNTHSQFYLSQQQIHTCLMHKYSFMWSLLSAFASQAYLRQYGYLNDPADPQDPHYLEEVIEALR